MKPTELRIGNLIYHPEFCEVMKVTSIQDDLINFAIKIYDVEPIKLSEEWMVKFGFMQNKNSGFQSDFYSLKNSYFLIGYHKSLSEDCFAYETYDYRNYDGERLWIDSVHQLQNLYYALNQKELLLNEFEKLKER